ncbi:MAG: hypothetical protein ACRDIV_01590, partial [Ktedonobacteraceae bacterium]
STKTTRRIGKTVHSRGDPCGRLAAFTRLVHSPDSPILLIASDGTLQYNLLNIDGYAARSKKYGRGKQVSGFEFDQFYYWLDGGAHLPDQQVNHHDWARA